MEKILMLEDDLDLREMISQAFEKKYELTAVSTVQEALEAIEKSTYNAILLDLSLPDGDGFQVCAYLKAKSPEQDLPIIFLTGNNEISRKLAAFSMGADDYLVKPCNLLELKARVDAKIRRNKDKEQRKQEFVRGDLRFDISSHRVWIGNKLEIQLTPIEFKLLLHFAQNDDRVLSRDQLIETLWGTSSDVFDRTIDTHVCKLRRKLRQSQSKILPVRGIGYRFSGKRLAIS